MERRRIQPSLIRTRASVTANSDETYLRYSTSAMIKTKSRSAATATSVAVTAGARTSNAIAAARAIAAIASPGSSEIQ